MAKVPAVIALATCQELPSLDPDESSLAAAFAKRGLQAVPVVWDNPAVDWRRFESVILRNTWDYHEHVARFRQWLVRLESERVRVWNPPSAVLANLHKGYLRDLESRGIPIVPTHWINPRGGDRDLAGILERNGWNDVVLKPAISAGSRNTYRFSKSDAGAYRKHLDAILDEDTALLQPFLPEIVEEGEWSFLFFGGEHSHTVLKTPRAGDFRVQEHFGGRYREQKPSARQLAQARAVIERVESPLLYARVDMVQRGGEMLLAELEITEPSLYFKQSAGSEDRFVAAYQRLTQP